MAISNVAHMELVLGSRKSTPFLWRWLYAGWLALQLGWMSFYYWITASIAQSSFGTGSGTALETDSTFQFVAGVLHLFLWQQMVLLLLASPAIAAGAITDEKERGTLQYMLTAELTSAEIVIGKLLGRLALIGNIFLSGLPILFVTSGFLGLGVGFLLGVLLHAAAIAFAITSASLLASVWSKHSRDAIVHLYLVLGLLLLAVSVAFRIARSVWGSSLTQGNFVDRWAESAVAVVRFLDPSYILEATLVHASLGEVLGRALTSSAAWSGLGLACLALAIARLRPAYRRQLEGRGKRRMALLLWARPPVQGEPLRWKERYVTGLAPLPVLRYVPQGLVMLLIFLATTAAVVLALAACDKGPSEGADGFLQTWQWQVDHEAVSGFVSGISALVLLLASLIVGIRASGAITGEREKHTWEALLMTPLETASLVRAKLWGIIGATYPYLLMYAIPMLFLSLLGGPGTVILFLVSLGVTWLAMFYTGATGLWCSARSTSSWRSLLGTLAYAYLGGFVVLVALTPILMMVWMLLTLFVLLLEQLLFGTASGAWSANLSAILLAGYITVALAFLAGSWFFLKEAEKRVADYDRARHWKLEKKRRPKKTPVQVVEWETSPEV